MKRRKLLKAGAVITGYTFLMGGVSAAFLSCKSESEIDWQPAFLTPSEAVLVSALADRIIPASDTPGALDAGVDRFIDENINVNFSPRQKAEFRKGLALFDRLARDKYKKSFSQLSTDKMDDLLIDLDREVSTMDSGEVHIWETMKDMTKFGFFTSEAAAKHYFVYDAIPGDYIGCVDYSTVKAQWAI